MIVPQSALQALYEGKFRLLLGREGDGTSFHFAHGSTKHPCRLGFGFGFKGPGPHTAEAIGRATRDGKGLVGRVRCI
jgi:hypothetical protein